MTGTDQMTADTREECSVLIKNFYEKLADELYSNPKVSPTLLMFMADPFARMLIFRFVFCRLVLLSLKLPADAENTNVLLPTCNPSIPAEILEGDICKDIVKNLANLLSNSQWFDFDDEE
ncbi:Protein SCAI [Entamoeba marina]